MSGEKLYVIKRDGRKVLFDVTKIIAAVEKAMNETETGIDADLAFEIGDKIQKLGKTLNVEEIQDLVENMLMDSERKDAAKKYILYRDKRTQQREMKSTFVKNAFERISGKGVVNANANVDEFTFGGRKQEASSALQKEIALKYNMSPDLAKAHIDGLIYHHDMDSWNVGMHNCLFLNFTRLFKNGFKTRNGDVRPPNGLSTATQQYVVCQQLQSQVQFGGVASAHIDFDLAPFVAKSFVRHFKNGLRYFGVPAKIRFSNAIKHLFHQEQYTLKDEDICLANIDKLKRHYKRVAEYAMDMLEREGRQSCEALFHNLNTLESRAGSQVPFTSQNHGRDTSPEGRLINRWLLEASIAGIGRHHKTSIFPISIFVLKDGVNLKPGDPNYDLKRLAIESMSKRIYPNFANGDWSQAHEDPDDPDTWMATMGCRTLIGQDVNGLGNKRVGRGNNVPCTIILPKLGIEYGICLGKREKPDLDGFWKAFEDALRLVEKAHLERYEILAGQSPKSAPFMYENGTIEDADKCITNVREALKHNTFAIGYIGIAEMCQALFGDNHVWNKKAYDFALQVVRRINEFCKEATVRNNLNFGCYAAPAESLCHTALKKLRDQYGVIENVTSREYLTNSHHTPVWEKVDIYTKLDVEAPFCKYATAGCITYVECESTFMKNLDAVEDVIDYAMSLDIPYLAFNFPIDTCEDCGYQSDFDGVCPECGSENIVSLRRVTGYLTSDYRRFNNGKQAEVRDRVKHSSYTQFGAKHHNE